MTVCGAKYLGLHLTLALFVSACGFRTRKHDLEQVSRLAIVEGTAGVAGGEGPLVTVASQLSMPIQRQAAHVLGFDETHMGILHSPEVAEHLNAILAEASA